MVRYHVHYIVNYVLQPMILPQESRHVLRKGLHLPIQSYSRNGFGFLGFSNPLSIGCLNFATGSPPRFRHTCLKDFMLDKKHKVFIQLIFQRFGFV